MPAFGDFIDDPTASNYDTASGGSGSALDSILSSVTQLGTAALISYGPQNQAKAINPAGSAAGFGGLTPMAPTTGLMGIIVVVVLIVGGIFIFKKM